MARYMYGGGGDGDIVQPNGLPFINATAQVYTSRTGGTLITDLQTVLAVAIGQVTSDAYGQVVFLGPDAYIGVLWLDFGVGPRWAIAPKAVDLAAKQAIAVQRQADNSAPGHTQKALLPYSAQDPLEQNLANTLDPLVIPRYASASARDNAIPAPQNGDRCWRTDLKADQVYDGTTWQVLAPVGSWLSGSFTITPASGTFNLGSGTQGLRYQIQGKVANFYLWLSFGTDTTYGTGAWLITGLPFTMASGNLNVQPIYGETAIPNARFPCIGQPASQTSFVVYAPRSTTASDLIQIAGGAGGVAYTSGNFIRLSGAVELA